MDTDESLFDLCASVFICGELICTCVSKSFGSELQLMY